MFSLGNAIRAIPMPLLKGDRLHLLALRTLEDALAQAHYGPVQPNWGHRLALAFLAKSQVGLEWHYARFWQDMCDGYDWSCTTQTGHYLRTTSLSGLLDHWYQALGLARPSLVQRGQWARRYNPDIDSESGTPQLPCMCNRYTPGDRQRIERVFDATMSRAFNEGPATVHPKNPGWIVRLENGKRVLEQMTWGFPVSLKGKQGQPLRPKPVNNARFDKLGGFWKPWAADPKYRCLIPAARYAEAVGTTGHMTETWLSVKGQPIFAWAGLWRPFDEWGDCYTGVMTSCAQELAHIHDRAPVILDPGQWESWLNAPFADLGRFDHVFPAERLEVEATDTPWVERK